MIFELQAQEYRSPLPSQPKPPKTPLRPPLPPAPNPQSSLQTLSPSPPSLSPSPPPLALSPPSPAPSLLTRGPCPRLQILPSRSPRPLPPPSSNSSVSRTVEYPPQPLPLPLIPQTPSVTKAAASAPRERHPVTMAEEAAASETSATVAQPAETVAVVGNVNPTEHEKSGITVDATVESTAQGGAESVSVSNGDNAGEASGSDPQKSLEFADELMEKGNTAMKENDFGEAADNFSRALEIRVSRYGELAPECVHTYYKYGCALLYKAQEEADPLADVPKKEDGSQHGSTKDGSMKSSVNAESSTASFSSNIEQDVTSTDQGPAVDDESAKNDQEEDEEDSDAEDLAEADEDESDLDLAWKMLDIARAIVEKHSVNTIEQVDILSALADVALEREDFETSLSDYQKALSILEQLVEPDDRKIADLNFRICLCLEVGSRPQEAIPYCEKATSVCKARLHRLTEEVKRISDSTSSVSESQQNVQTSEFENSVSDKQAEIETLKGLSSELEKKLEDLQQLVLNPKSILSEILGIAAAKAGAKESSPGKVSSSQMATADSSAGFDSPTISTAHTNGSTGVTHLGVVGRGVKRPSNSSVPEASAPKKPSLESTDGKGDGDKS